MAGQTNVPVTPGSGKNIDGYTTTGGNIRQVVALGDPLTDANIVAVDSNGKIGINALPNVTVSSLPNVTVGSALPAGSNLIGKVSTDQTTHGTSDLVAADITKVAGSTISQGHGTAATAIRVELPTDGTGTVGLNAGTNTVGAVNLKPTTSGGWTTYHLVSANSTNATVVKNSAGQLGGWYIYNSNAAARKLAFHNASTTPTAGASIYFTLVIPPSSAANVEFANGIPFSTGIAITTVTGLADSDNTAVALNDLIINLFYA